MDLSYSDNNNYNISQGIVSNDMIANGEIKEKVEYFNDKKQIMMDKNKNDENENEVRDYDGETRSSGLVELSSRVSEADMLAQSNISNPIATTNKNSFMKIETNKKDDDNNIIIHDGIAKEAKRTRTRSTGKGIGYNDNKEEEGDDVDRESDVSSEYDNKRKNRKLNGNYNQQYKRKYIPCMHAKCRNRARGKDGLCIRHGGGPRCLYEGCTSGARDSSQLCMHHGGGARCSHESGCAKGAVGGMFCIRHGGGKRCMFDGCSKSAFRHYGYCSSHMKMMKSGKGNKRKAQVSNVHQQSNDESMNQGIDTGDNADKKKDSKRLITNDKVLNDGSSSFNSIDEIITSLENKIGNHSIPKEISIESCAMPGKNIVNHNSSPNISSAGSVGITSSPSLHSAVDQRVHISPYNVPLMPLNMNQPIGNGYNPYSMYGFSPVPYFNPPYPMIAPVMAIHPQMPYGFRPTQDMYRPPS